MDCENSAKMPSSFLTLVKEEPADVAVAMEVSNRPMPISIGRPATSAAVLPESQMQSLSMAQINPSNFQSQTVTRGEIDPNFEPVSRGRSNTWPLPCPEGYVEGEDHVLLEPSTSGEQNRVQGSVPNFMDSAGGAPKKNTSRRNPWGNMSYADLIAQAILSSPEGRATLSQIYDWMVQNINYFKDKGDSNSSAGWKNSIRHNLSLHSRFMRMQNEGTGKSSWWVLNPDAKPGKSTRRRANTLEGGSGRLEKSKRGRMRKKVENLRNGLDAPVSPSEGPIDFYPSSPSSGPGLHSSFQLSPQDYRPRASSNASSCGRLSPIPAMEADMHDSQVPPVSPGVAGWGPDYWSANNHIHGGQPAHLRGIHPHHEHYTDQLVDSIGENLSLGTRENWPPHNGINHNGMNGANSDCMKISPHSMHPLPMNGFLNHHHHHHSGFGSYEDFSRYCPPNPLNRGFQPPLHEKTNQQRHPHHFQMPALQNVSPAHSLSPPNGVVEGPPSYSSPPQSHHQSAPQNHMHITTPPSHHNPSTSHHTTPPGPPHQGVSPSSQNSPLSAPISSTSQPFSVPITTASHHNSPTGHHRDLQQSTSTAMLRVAFSHRDTSSCALTAAHKLNSLGHPAFSNGVGSDLADLDNFQGGLECNVDEILEQELKYGEEMTFDFQQTQQNAALAYNQSYGNPHANPSSQLAGATGPSAVVQCASIQAGNHWVR